MKNHRTLLILLFFSSFAAVLAVLYTPALPSLAKELNISESQAQRSLSVYLVGYALGFLIWGPLANFYGRKKTTLIGLILANVGCLIVLLIKVFPSSLVLNTGRLITALGSSVGLKIAFTYISDLYTKEEAPSKIAYLTLSFAIAPGIAIAIGGLLTKYFGFYSCFLLSFGYSLFLLFLTLQLPETLKENAKISLNGVNIFKGYLATLQNKTFLKSSILMGCGTCFIYLFAQLAPFIGITEMGLKPQVYGLWNFIPPIGMVLGFSLTQGLHNKMKPLDQIKLGILIASCFIAYLMFSFSHKTPTPLSLFLPIPGIYIGLSVVFANASSFAIAQLSDKSNSSAMANFINMSLCVITLFIAEALPYKPSKILPTSFGILCVTMFFLWSHLNKTNQKKA
jgi:MFS family permease